MTHDPNRFAKQRENNIKSQSFLFVHIPKTGGTTIAVKLKELYNFKSLTSHLTYHQLLAINEYEPLPYSFAIVREPVDLLKSFYRFALTDNSFWHNEALPHAAKSLLSDKSFDQFIDALYEAVNNPVLNLDWYTPLRRFKFWGLKPQYEYVTIDNQIVVDYIGSYHKYSETYTHIFNNILGEDLPPPPIINKSNHNINISYTNETLQKIHELYKLDYELLSNYF